MTRMQKKEQKFVYVACGSDEHIRRLQLSIRALKKFSKKDIIVVTDALKNQVSIEYDKIISIPTPSNLNAHQSVIFLKTSLHRYLENGPIYTYLDTDIIARSSLVNRVFDHFINPVAFATDYVDIQHFSPAAMMCGCVEKFRHYEKTLTGLFETYDPNYFRMRNPDNRKKIARIEQLNTEYRKNNWWTLYKKFKHWFDPHHIHLTDFTHYVKRKTGYTWNDKDQTWLDDQGKIIYSLDTAFNQGIEACSGYRFDETIHAWKAPDGQPVNDVKCSHLQDAISERTGISIPGEWRHWNGGLFIFDERSAPFLEDWHRLSVDAFRNPYWVTRDQGTLATAVWKQGLQRQSTLPAKFNFIFTPRFRNARYLGKNTFALTSKLQVIKPGFLHLIDGITDSTRYFWGLENDGEVR